MSDLQAVLDGKEEEVVEDAVQEVVEETVDEAAAETAETEEQPKGEEEAAPPVAENKDDDSEGNDKGTQTAPLTALLDEREKRQKLQQELEQLRRQAMPQEEERPDWYADPDAALNARTREIEQKFESRFLDLSEANAESRYDDFAEMKEYFLNMCKSNPALAKESMNQRDPWGHAYKTAKKHYEIEQVGDVDSFRNKVKQEVSNELQAQLNALKEENEALKKQVNEPKLPSSLSETRSAGGTNSAAESDSLDDVVLGS